MAARLVNIDRDTPLLLPPDLRQWVPDDDLVHFVIEAVNGMTLSSLKVNRRGSGSAQYPPKMMLALLIYCYANGIFSSRRIERATWRDVAVRYLTADTHPDHDTICSFRRQNFEAISEAFLEILKLAKALGLLKVGKVSIDGTHIAANASKDRNVRYDRAGELEEQLKLDIAELMKQAERTDQADEDAPGGDGQKLPEQIDRREKLRQKMLDARAQLEREAKAKAQAERGEYERKLAEREQREGKLKGPIPKAPDERPRDDQQTNLTDADSKLMRKSKRSAFTQSYNAQAAVDADGSMLILAGHVTNCASDANELIPALNDVPEAIGQPTAALADTGYANAQVIRQLQNDRPELELYVAVGREDNHDQRHYDYRPPSRTVAATKKVTDPTLLAMREKLHSDEGRRIYRLRKQTVEPVFGIIKSAMGFTRFLLRGLGHVNGEWSLVRLAYNVKRLWTLQLAG
jgi:transposase